MVKREEVSQKSAAEFFSEHQQIAGFDNPGKSLFTTIRELVENSLDAAESIDVLPNIKVSIVEYTEKEHNKLHGIKTHLSPTKIKKEDGDESQMSMGMDSQMSGYTTSSAAPKKKKGGGNTSSSDQMYYRISVCDNGCGIPEDNIGDMLGRVLSGSKHGVRQTRGKFGLGAKMALIWSKKSSGLPIEVCTAHASSADATPSPIVRMVLDIDIYKNLPKIINSVRKRNEDAWHGAEITLTIAGNFATYRARVLQYFQQLAVITPYADLDLDFTCDRDPKKSFHAEFRRRSEQMPTAATEILPHPCSLNNITLNHLLKKTDAAKMTQFLTKELSGVTTAVATIVAKQCSIENKTPQSLNSAQVAALHQRLRDQKGIRDPSPNCLSPAGEYNLRLGILKEMEPRMAATYTEKPESHEGHPFIVEAAVSIGGKKVREGINVYRFANRIPLLFEVGADVVTNVAMKCIKWGNYHINTNTDRIGVFVSIVSTKIPFKGTSKEYVGEDVTPLKDVVKKCLCACLLQLKANLLQKMQKQSEQERKKLLVKFIPNISKSLFSVLQKINAKENDEYEGKTEAEIQRGGSLKKRKTSAAVANGTLTDSTIGTMLHKAVDRFEAETALQMSARESTEHASKENRVKLLLTPYAPLPNMDHQAWTPVVGTNGNVKVLVNYNYADASFVNSGNGNVVQSASKSTSIPKSPERATAAAAVSKSSPKLSLMTEGFAMKIHSSSSYERIAPTTEPAIAKVEDRVRVQSIKAESAMVYDLTSSSPSPNAGATSSSNSKYPMQMEAEKALLSIDIDKEVTEQATKKRSRSILMALEDLEDSDSNNADHVKKTDNRMKVKVNEEVEEEEAEFEF